MRILITAGPTREYLDDVRFLSNSSSGKMGFALAEAALALGHNVDLVCGPVSLSPPAAARFHAVETTREMYDACLALLPSADGVVAAAAVCDYRPRTRVTGKIKKTGGAATLELVETEDILAELGRRKEHRWIVGFALEAQDARENAMRKLKSKRCDAIVLNRPTAIGSDENSIELIDGRGETRGSWSGSKSVVAAEILHWINTHLSPIRIWRAGE